MKEKLVLKNWQKRENQGKQSNIINIIDRKLVYTQPNTFPLIKNQIIDRD